MNENNKLIAEFMELEYFPKMKAAKHNVYGGFDGWTNIDDVWIKNPTKELREHLILDNPEEVGLDSDFKLCEKSFYTLKYDISWDELMPVVEKIESIDYDAYLGQRYAVTIENDWCHISHHAAFNGVTKTIAGSNSRTDKPKLEITYKVVIEFIKWYNLQK